MIVFDEVTKKYPLGNIALDNVSFRIDANEFIFFVGPSGAGKTTILKLLLRQISPSKGSITVDDFILTDKKFKKIEQIRRKIGIVFQDFKILDDKNVFENISLSLKVVGAANEIIRNEVKEALKLVNLVGKEKFFLLNFRLANFSA